jgi:hypothetical protein
VLSGELVEAEDQFDDASSNPVNGHSMSGLKDLARVYDWGLQHTGNV